MSFTARILNALAIAFACVLTSGPAFGQQDERASDLNLFIHYALTANPDMAVAHGQKLLDSGITNAELATLIDEGDIDPKRLERGLLWAQRNEKMERVASEIGHRAELGRRDLGRDPKRIEEAVKMLTGAQRSKLLGRQRLEAAQEYAVPALLKEITEGRDESLKLACQDVLTLIGRQAVYPLCVALPDLTGAAQRTVCDVLAQIKHPSAAPYLKEVALDETADSAAREAANRAFAAVGGREAGLSDLYAALSRQYFDAHESLIAFPAEPTNNVWSYSTITGLSPTPVPTEIFTEVLAVSTASKAVALNAGNNYAISLFVASNLKRENDLPEGATDPIHGAAKYTPEFYATVFGTQTCLDVLGLGLDKVDTPLVRDAIAALSRTTGGANLFARGGARSPLLEALVYPDRRVQYDAALTLARALPQEQFNGAQTVVPILASAVRTGNKSLALVLADDQENRSAAAKQLEQVGFQIVAQGAVVGDALGDINRAVGIDLIVIRVADAAEAGKMIDTLRAIPKTAAAPVLVLVGATDVTTLVDRFRHDRRVNVTRANVDPEQFTAALDSVMARASGGRITEAEAEEYAIRSLDALRDIAISRSPVYAVADAESSLIDGLDARTGGTRLLVADILALMDSDAAQRKLFDAALGATGDEQVEMLRRVADSVRQSGDHAEKRHIAALLDLVQNSSGDVAEAAATVHGALNLATSDAVLLIPQ